MGKGYAQIAKEYDTIGDRVVYKAYYNGETSKFFSLFFHLSDTFISWVDRDALIPLRYRETKKEGSWRHYEDILFYHEDTIAYSQKTFDEYPIVENIGDMVSIYLYHRSIDLNKLEIGTTYLFDVYFDKKKYKTGSKYIGKEEIKTKMGKINCLKFVPILDITKLFKDSNDLLVYVSDNEKKFVVKVVVVLNIGKLTITLRKFN